MTAARVDAVVVGGGQAGLATGHELAQQGAEFVILEAASRIGDAWRRRWDSLRLFTPASASGLPGMPFPAPGGHLPTKDEMADYLEAYAARFRLPVRLTTRVDGLEKEGDRYLVSAGDRRWEAARVVVAGGAAPWVPPFAAELHPALLQLHAEDYRSPEQLPGGEVVVVGAGNSGVEIALEVAASRPTWLAGRDVGVIPGDPQSLGYRIGSRAFPALRFLNADTGVGRALLARARQFRGGHPVVGLGTKDLVRAGVRRVPRVAGVQRGHPLLEDGRILEVATVVWATGYVRDHRWIRLPAFGDDRAPLHHRGLVSAHPGLGFVGLPFQSSLLSGLVAGAGPDARYVVRHLGGTPDTGGHRVYQRPSPG